MSSLMPSASTKSFKKLRSFLVYWGFIGIECRENVQKISEIQSKKPFTALFCSIKTMVLECWFYKKISFLKSQQFLYCIQDKEFLTGKECKVSSLNFSFSRHSFFVLPGEIITKPFTKTFRSWVFQPSSVTTIRNLKLSVTISDFVWVD